MKLFKKKDSEIYYSSKDIDSTDSVYRVVIGQRSNGKTYNCIRKAIQEYFKNGKASVYIRRYGEEIRPKNLTELLQPHYKLIEKLSGGKFDCATYRNNQFILCKKDSETGKVDIKDTKPILFTIALNTWNTTKGQDRGEINFIIFDEFMTRDLYLQDEFATFANVISSVVRDREVNCIYMLANTVNKYSPYFEEMGLDHVNEQEQGTIEIYSYNNEKLTVAVEYCAAATATKNIEHYYAFDNPQLDMIKNGNWEESNYKRLTKLDKCTDGKTVIQKFLIRFNHKEIIGEIRQEGINLILYFHWKGNSNYNFTDTDFIFTDEDCISPYHQNSFGGGTTRVHQIIRQLLNENKDYYSSNAVGEVVNNFKKYCRT